MWQTVFKRSVCKHRQKKYSLSIICGTHSDRTPLSFILSWRNVLCVFGIYYKCLVIYFTGGILFKFCIPQDEQKEILSDKFRCDGDYLFQKKKAAQIERQREKLIKFYIRLSHHFVTKINSPGFSLTGPGDYPARKNLSYVFIFMYSYYIFTFEFRKFILSPFCSKFYP